MKLRTLIKNKKLMIITAIMILIAMFSGCGADEKKVSSDLKSQPSSHTDSSQAAGTSQPSVSEAAFDLNDIDVDITEKMYVSYINEIYINPDDYLGKVIRIEGMFKAYTDENTGNTYYYVYRTGPGCCGNDGAMCGFEFTWSGEMPKDNDWIEVVGSLRSYEDDGWDYLTLDAKSVTVMEARGAETVYQ